MLLSLSVGVLPAEARLHWAIPSLNTLTHVHLQKLQVFSSLLRDGLGDIQFSARTLKRRDARSTRPPLIVSLNCVTHFSGRIASPVASHALHWSMRPTCVSGQSDIRGTVAIAGVQWGEPPVFALPCECTAT